MDTDSPACIVRTGERAAFVRGGGLLLPDGRYIPPGEVCTYEPGSGWSARMVDRDASPGAPMPDHDPSLAAPEPLPVEPVSAAPAATPTPATPAHHAAVPLAAGSESGDIGQAIGVVGALGDNPWTPLIVVILAVVAVLGGRQGWKYWSERSAQRHELELKRLELAEKQAGLGGAQPPPCVAKDATQDAKIADLESRLATVERKSSSLGAFDPEAIEDLEKRVKRLERRRAPSEEA